MVQTSPAVCLTSTLCRLQSVPGRQWAGRGRAGRVCLPRSAGGGQPRLPLPGHRVPASGPRPAPVSGQPVHTEVLGRGAAGRQQQATVASDIQVVHGERSGDNTRAQLCHDVPLPTKVFIAKGEKVVDDKGLRGDT